MSIIAILAVGWWLYYLSGVSAEVRRDRALDKRLFPTKPVTDRRPHRS